LIFLSAGITNSVQRLVSFDRPTKEHGLQDILEYYHVTASNPVDWKFYAVYEGVDPRKRQVLALV
jgi:hypothetical protein